MLKRTSIALLACACLFGQAHADEIAQKAKQLNRRAMEDYDSLEFDAAKGKLQEALNLLRGSDEKDLLARTYGNLGVVYVNGLKDRARGRDALVGALRIKPDYKPDAAVTTPELEETFAAALKLAKRAGPSRPVVVERPPEEPRKLEHRPVDEAHPGAPLVLRAAAPSDANVSRVNIYYRGSDKEDFIPVAMSRAGSEWSGSIPAEALHGTRVEYYLEAMDARGRVVASAGGSRAPFAVSVTPGGARPASEPDVAVEDAAMREAAAKKRRDEERRRSRDHLFVFVMPGFGFGVEPGGNHTEVAWQWQASTQRYTLAPVGATGVAVAPFHLGIEVGYLINEHFSISLLGRFQLVNGGNAETVRTGQEMFPSKKPFGAVAGFVRARYRFREGRFHPYLHLDFGVGEIRHFIDLSLAESTDHPLVDKYTADQYNGGNQANLAMYQQEVCSNHKNCTDTISLGYVFLGGGAGIWYDFASHLAFILDVNLLGGLGVGGKQGGFNVDVQAGLGAHFL